VLWWATAIGFLSFQLALALGVMTLSLGWDPRAVDSKARMVGWRHGAAAGAFLLCVWFHPVVAAMVGLALLLLEGRRLSRLREWARLAVVVGTGTAFLFGSYLARASADHLSTAWADTHFSDPVSVLGSAFEYNIGYTPFELLPRLAALFLLAPAAYHALRSQPFLGSGAEAAIGRLVLTLLVLYCVLPGTFAGWAFCSARFLSFGLLLLPVAAEFSPRWLRRLPVLGPALAFAVLAIQWPAIHRSSLGMQDVLDVSTALPRGAKIIPLAFNLSVLGPQPTGAAWAELVVEHDAIASQLFAAGRPKMGGEGFRTLSFRPGVQDEETGRLPWSGFEMSDCWRPCVAPGSPDRWFVHVDKSCSDALSERKHELERVIDRYDYVLMLGPARLGQDLLAPHLRLISHVGSAWMYGIVHPSG
ncbi:MAG: hypothetical protein ACRELB_25390, partial [Polyangiaceae bacterium]